MAIKDLNINASLQHEDIIPIFDSANGRTRAVLAKTIKEYSENKKAYISGSVEGGKLYLNDAKGNKELIGPVGDSGSVPYPIIDNAIYTYDQQHGWVDTGVRAVDGSIQTSAGSVSVGNYKLSSLGENFGFTNMRTSITYVSPWQELSETGNEGPVRVDFITDAKDVVRNADTSETITNPSWTVTAQTEDEALFRISITDAVSAIDDVYLVGHISGENEFRVKLGNLRPGQNDFILQYPLFIKQVDTVTASLVSKNGDVVVKGKNGIPAYQVRIRDYKETTDNSQLRVEEADGTDAVDNVVTIKTKGILLTDEGSGVIELEVTQPHSSIGAHFVGIYNDLESLKDAIGAPANNYQAIVITPSEKYYHGVAGAWVELAPVGNLHPNYLGVYDTLQDLEAAYPTPGDESMAIVGTAEKVFYLYINSAWKEIKGTDLPALTGRVSVLESDVSSLKGRISGLGQDITQLQGQVYTGNKLIGDDGTTLNDITGFEFVGAEVEDPDDDKTAKITVKSQITVANGQEPTSTSDTGNALIFPGATITPDPNDANVITIGRTNTPSFDPSIFDSAVDHGEAAASQTIGSDLTTDGWWLFKDGPADKPSNSKGYLTVFKKTVNAADPSNKHEIFMAMGDDTSDKKQIWMVYRDSGTWSPWLELSNASQSEIDTINTEITALKSADAAAVARLTALETKIGSIYAPNKAAFDKDVNELITAALKNHPAIHVVYPTMKAKFSTSQVPVNLDSAVGSNTGQVTLTRGGNQPRYISILVENDAGQADKVATFSINGSMAESMPSQATTINGQVYKAFYTSYASFTARQAHIAMHLVKS